MVHVNGKKVGGNANICKFTAYVSPYFVVSNGGAYTKHIYAASQRIASKLGNEDGFGADPRRVEMAGGKNISDFQKGNVGERFKALGYEYSAPEKEKVEKDSTMDSKAEEKLIFFYHPDHLGSTSYVTDADGNIAQHIEYIPYGEVFVEERNSQFSTNFLFNAKELDNETGLYYYGARYLDPTGAMWLSVDPMWENNIDANPYNYCHGNPVVMVDPDGLHDYRLDEDGTISLLNETGSEHDVLYASAYTKDESQKNNFIKYNTDRKGNKTIANKSIDVKKGILSSCEKSASVKSLPQGNSITSDGKDHLYHYSFGSDKKESMNFFKFVAANTEVEWSLTEINMNGIDQFDVFTSCNPIYERFGGNYAETYAPYLINFSHSHPKDKDGGNNAVSSAGDRFFRNKIQDKIKSMGSSNSPRFWIYPQGATWYTFDEKVEYTY